MTGEGHRVHGPVPGWRQPVDVPLSGEAWERILALLPPAGRRPSIAPYPEFEARWRRRREAERRHEWHEPHWAIVDPVTGRLLDTAECSAMLRRLRETPLPGDPDC